MLKSQPWGTIPTATLLTLATWFVPACGGSAEFSAGGAGARSSAGAGGSGNASGSSAGGAGSSSGSNTGGASGFGATGGVSCANVNCLAIGCGDGYEAVLLPGDCCATCVPDGSGGTGGDNLCARVDCPAIDCFQGYKYEAVAGRCCGTCVPDPQACSDSQAGYKRLRELLLSDPELSSCEKAADCRFLAPNARCGSPCATQPVNAQAAVAAEAQLSEFAAENCSSCAEVQAPCPKSLPPSCVDGKCSFN